MNTQKNTAPQPESLEWFLSAAIARAQASADSCIALYRSREATFSSFPTPADLHEMNEACDLWLAKRALSQRRAA